MEDNKTPMVSQIDAEKLAMYQNFAIRRSMIMVIAVIVGFIIYASIFIVGYTIRDNGWKETTLRIVETLGVQNEVQQNANLGNP